MILSAPVGAAGAYSKPKKIGRSLESQARLSQILATDTFGFVAVAK